MIEVRCSDDPSRDKQEPPPGGLMFGSLGTGVRIFDTLPSEVEISVLKSFVQTFVALGATLPAAVSGVIGLIAAAEKVGFQQNSPEQYGKLVYCANVLLYIATEHWLAYIILCLCMAFFWALVVAEPKAESKRKFDERRRKRHRRRK